jgi:outer membrane receptor for ferrienterochelin and colicin
MTHFTASNRDTTNDSLLGEVIYQTPVGDCHFLTTGMEFRNEDFTRTASAQKEQTIFSLYAQDEIQINDSWSTVVGIRMEDHPETETVFCPSIALMNKMSEKTTLRASVARGFKAPTLQELYEYHFFHKTYFRDGNANLDPEYSTNYSLGLEHDFNDALKARVTAFRHDFKDLIILQDTGVDDGGFDVLQRQNVNEAYSQGIESECRYNISPNMHLIMGYTYLDTEDDDGNPLSYMPKHRTNVNLYYNMPKQGLGFWLTLENAWSRTYKDKNDEMQDLDDFTLLNLNITKKINDSADVFFRVDNVLAEKFTIYEEGKNAAGFGRAYTVGLRMTF